MALVWEGAIIASKLLSYVAMVAIPGAALVLWLADERRSSPVLLAYQLGAALIGFLASAAFFVLQVGAVNRQGPGGMFDPQMISIMAQTSLGTATGLRLAGFALAAAGVWLASGRPASMMGRNRAGTAMLLWVPASLLLAAPMAVQGHVSELSPLLRAAVVAHILSASLWVGALYPLYHLGRRLPTADLSPLMHRFGNHARVLLLVLLLSGALLLWQLAGSWQGLLRPWGALLLLKLGLVAALAGFAAWNRFRLVPALSRDAGAGRLRRSIASEMALAGLILLVTALLTTVAGPEQAA